jgi:hypothetical protein
VAAEVISWSDSEIVAVAPDGVGIGCVGFVVGDGAMPADPVETATDALAVAGMVQSILGDRYGPHGVLLGQCLIDHATRAAIPRLPCPPCLPAPRGEATQNRFAGRTASERLRNP